MPYRKPSIYKFLLVGLLSFTFAYFSITYWVSQKQAVHEIEELFDAQLLHSANILFNLLGESVSTIDQDSKHLPVVYHGLESMVAEPSSRTEKNALRYQRKLAYQIFNPDGKLLIKSNSAPDEPLGTQKIGISRIILSDHVWRVVTYYDEDWQFWLHVAESESIREELADEIAKQTLLPGLIGLPIMLLIMMFIIQRGMNPLKSLASMISQRDPKNLQPIDLAKAPKEVRPVVWAINSLLMRLHDAIAREQRLTADAAHELRTPLAVVMLHAQNALAAQEESQRTDSLKELEQGIMRIRRLLEQLLTLSKVNPETIPRIRVNLADIGRNVVAEMAPMVYEQDHEIEWVNEDLDLWINGSDFLLETLIRNLIDNGVMYSPKKGLIRVTTVKNAAGFLELVVEDSGAGVEEEQLSKLTDRFFRVHQGEGKGAGLGLSLVKSIVEFHGGQLVFTRSDLGGLRVSVAFPDEK